MTIEPPMEHDDEPPPTGLSLDVEYTVPDAGLPDRDDFHAWAVAALPSEMVQERSIELALRIVAPEESRELNHQWRDRDRPTNVLSFPGEDMPGLPWRHLGDLVICAEVVAREAREQNKEVEAHWAHMVVHGVLHLLGHDHEIDVEAEAMEDLERRILAELGYSDPYKEDFAR